MSAQCTQTLWVMGALTKACVCTKHAACQTMLDNRHEALKASRPSLPARPFRRMPTDPSGSRRDELAPQGNVRQEAPPMRTAVSNAAQLHAHLAPPAQDPMGAPKTWQGRRWGGALRGA